MTGIEQDQSPEVGKAMRCYKIQFDGYKRLVDTGCNVDRRILAFVGPNEVGKTSVLRGLEWLTDPDDLPLTVAETNPTRIRTGEERVVGATYRLSGNDKTILAALNLEKIPDDLYVERRANGSTATALKPGRARRNTTPFTRASTALASAAKRLEMQIRAAEAKAEDDEEAPRPHQWVGTLAPLLKDTEHHWDSDQIDHAEELIVWLREVAPTSRSGKPRDEKAAGLIEEALAIGRTEPPDAGARDAMLARVPRFLRFTETDRELSLDHNLADEQVRLSPQPALANLLKIADLNLDVLWGYASGADTHLETLLKDGNARLKELFSGTWNQEKVTVYFKVSGTILKVMVDELTPGGGATSIEERSDGLQAFIALVAFIECQDLEIPPILLIDEAETHLHLDAQADLVDVLLQSLNATQIFYTTHSPGCLPRDLGTSVRLVRRDKTKPKASLLHADFWSNKEPGFSPLLFAMGASAAAFSVCRRAVLAEGAADMILLPSMIRKATGIKEDIGYQIAPGLSNAHAYGMNVEEVAARVVYLTDGDDGGETLKGQLDDAGVSEDRIFSLPEFQATEDLLDLNYYLAIVNGLMPDDAPEFRKKDVKAKQPIGKSLKEWGKKTGAPAPGKVAVGSAITEDEGNIVLAAGAEAVLKGLHKKFITALEKKPSRKY